MNSLRDFNIRVCSSAMKNVVGIATIGNKSVFTENGLFSRMFLFLKEHYGFSYDLKVVEIFGQRMPNGTWTGKVGAAQRNECEVAGPFALTYERTEVFNFAHAISAEDGVFFLRKPEQMSKLYAPIHPFAINVWVSAIIAFIIVGFIFYCVLRLDSKLNQRNVPSLYNVFWSLFGSFAAKDSTLFDRHGSNRWIVLGWLLAFFVLTSSYSGALMSFIAFPGYEKVPEKFSELADALERGRYTASTLEKSALVGQIRAGKKGINLRMRNMWDKGRITGSGFNQALFSKMLTENHAMIFYDTISKAILGSILKNFIESKDSLFSDFISFAFRKDFSFLKEFNKGIRRCTEAGLILKFIKDSLKDAGLDLKDMSTKEAHPLYLHDVLGALALLTIGYITSILVFLIEVIIGKVSKIRLFDDFEIENN